MASLHKPLDLLSAITVQTNWIPTPKSAGPPHRQHNTSHSTKQTERISWIRWRTAVRPYGRGFLHLYRPERITPGTVCAQP